MKKFYYFLLFASIILVTQLQAQNYWLEFKINDSTKYFTIAEIENLSFSDVTNPKSQLILHFVNSAQSTVFLNEIKQIQFTEVTSTKDYKITITKTNDSTVFGLDTLSKLEFGTYTSVGEEIDFVDITDNYPNPFQTSTTIEFSLLIDCRLEIAIFDLYGNEIRKLEDNYFTRGKHTISWDGRSDDGSILMTGIYYCSIRSNKGAIINKMLKVR